MTLSHEVRPALAVVRIGLLYASVTLAACGGGGSSNPPPPPPPPPPPTTIEAFALLNQATFGATLAEASTVAAMDYDGWLDEQLVKPASLQLPHLQSLPLPPVQNQLQIDRVDVWARNAVNGDDQLRQRVAFALSEIMVVSQIGALNNAPFAMADYYDVLARGAFGNYRDLIEEVTLHPAMGVYLSMLGNEKPNPTLNIRPDENYARELMQLFSIGLVQLNNDGTIKLDGNGEPIPTYDQTVIEGFAHVFTGWHWAGAPSFEQARRNVANQSLPMQLYPDFHDTGSKTLLDGYVIQAGQTGEQDLQEALDNVFNHPNVGPFIAYRLIQRLVTSNPTPAYVGRVAAVFNDNGQGVRGDLGDVVRATLLDAEAREVGPRNGKLKEPLLRLTQLYRAYDGQANSGKYTNLAFAYFFLGQGPLQSPSVFNFFSPFYAPAGEIRDAGLVAPEMQIATEFLNTTVTNLMFDQIFLRNSEATNLGDDDIFIDISEEVGTAADVDALVDLVDDKLLAGQMSTTLRTEIRGMLERVQPTDAALRAAEAIYLVVTSPEFAHQLGGQSS